MTYTTSDVEQCARGHRAETSDPDLYPDRASFLEAQIDLAAWVAEKSIGTTLVTGRRSPARTQVLDADSPTIYWADGYIGTSQQYVPIALRRRTQ